MWKATRCTALLALAANGANMGVEARVVGVDDSAQFVRAESEKWANVVREGNLEEAR